MQELINEYMVASDADKAQAAARLAARVGPHGLLDLIRTMGNELTQSNDQVRAAATECLASTLGHLPDLYRNELEVLTDFFSARVEDANSTRAAITGLRNLQKQAGFNMSMADTVLKSLKRLDMRALPQSERHAVFDLLEQLVSLQRPGFVATFVNLTSGEKDPQNLLISLRISKAILQHYELNKEQREDMFDVTFCYFPVTFTPPKDMPYQISAEELRTALRATLATPQLAEHVIPGLLGKLSAVNISVKEDTLQSLLAVVQNLDTGVLSAHWRAIWDGVKYEVLHGTPENPTYGDSVRVLQGLLRVGQDFIAAVESEFGQLGNRKLAPEVCRLIVGLSQDGHADVFHELAAKALHEILPEDKEAAELTPQVPLLNILLQTQYLIPEQDKVYAVLSAALGGDADFRLSAIDGLKRLAVVAKDFGPVISQDLGHLLLREDAASSDAATEGLAYIARQASELISTTVLTPMLAEIGNQRSLENVHKLSILARICVTKPLVHTLTIRLTGKVSTIDNDPEYLYEIIQTLLYAVRRLKGSDLVGYERVVFSLVKNFVLHESNRTMFSSDAAVDATSELLELAVRNIPDGNQEDYCRRALHLFISERQILTAPPTNQFALFVSSVAALKLPELPLIDLSFVGLAEKTAHSRSVYIRGAYLRFIALMANKWPATMGDVALYLQWLRRQIDTGSNVSNSLEVIAWVAKGLLLRADRLGFEVAEYLVSLLSNESIGPLAGRVFGVLTAKDRILSKDNGVVIRQLFRQRLFLQELDPLLAGFNTPLRVNYMFALSSLLRTTPLNVLASQLQRIFPPLRESLNIPIPQIQQTAIMTIVAMSPLKDGTLASQIGDIIPKLLELANDEASSESVRVAALQALASFAESLDKETIKPHVTAVVEGLVPALDDKRREVRRLATRGRELYYRLQ